MRNATLILLVLGLFAGASSAALPEEAQSRLGIAAIVNNTVISTLDLEERVNLVLATSGKPSIPELRETARKQLLPALVDETLRLEEARRYSIMVSSSEIDQAVRTIEAQQNKPPGSLEAFIVNNGLSLASFHQQIRSQVAWRKLLARKARRDISITEEEIRRTQERLARGRQIPEVQIASIVLPIAEDQEPQQILGLARDIRSQLIAGANAPELLRKYKDRIALEFGPVTWIAREELNPVIRQAVESVEVGQIAAPVETPLGFQIIRLLDTRTVSSMPRQNAEVAVKQIVLKLDNRSSDTEIDSKMSIARDIAKYPGTCTQSGIAGLERFDGLNVEVNYLRTTTANMSPEIRLMIEPLPVTGITEPFASEDGIHLLMLCERISVPVPLPDEEKVRALLLEEKLQLESEKYLRQLKREAFVDLRV